MTYRSVLILLIFSCSFRAMAQTDSLKKKELSISGFLDIYFSYQPHKRETEKVLLYNYRRSNALSMNLGMLSLNYEKDNWKAILSVQTGDFSKYNYAAEPVLFRHIYQASLQRQLSQKISVEAGIFPSHIGHESAILKDNWTLSRSLSAENTPYYETGVRANYLFSSKVKFSLLVLNGWQKIKDNNSWPAFGTKLLYTPNDKITVNSSTFIGNEQPKGYYGKVRYFHNFYTIMQLTSKFSALAAFDIGAQHNLKGSLDFWYNPALNFRYRFNKLLSAAVRGEYYNDKNQVIVRTGTENGINAWGGSVNFDFYINRFILWKIEARRLQSRHPVVFTGLTPEKVLLFYTASLACSF